MRFFGGKAYSEHETYHSVSVARREAEKLRKRGKLARIVKDKAGTYTVYKR